MPTIPLKAGIYTDSGYRLRKNILLRDDQWYPFNEDKNVTFYDMTFYNSDHYDVPEDKKLIAELYFRIETDLVTHKRVVY